MDWNTCLQAALSVRRGAQAYRSRTVRNAQTALPYLERGGVRYLNFGGDCPGLSRDETAIAVWQQAPVRYGTGSGGSLLASSHTHVHEAQLSGWPGYERALLFPGGYAANQTVLLGLLCRDGIMPADKLCHVSMQETAALSPAAFRCFSHLQYAVLERQLEACSRRQVRAAGEGVFSMDGDTADIGRLKALCGQYGAWLLLDDAHGFGVCCSEGRGSAADIAPDILVVTFGKAAGLMGAAVLCSIRSPNTCSSLPPLGLQHRLPARAGGRRYAHQGRRRFAPQAAKQYPPAQTHIGAGRFVGAPAALRHCHPAVFVRQQRKCAGGCRKTARTRPVCAAICPPTVPAAGRVRLQITLSAVHAPHRSIGKRLARCRLEPRTNSKSPAPSVALPLTTKPRFCSKRRTRVCSPCWKPVFQTALAAKPYSTSASAAAGSAPPCRCAAHRWWRWIWQKAC